VETPDKPESTDRETPEVQYSNYFCVGENAYEFIFDFGQCDPSGKEYVHTRIVSSPPHAREFYELFRAAITEHQQRYGTSGDAGWTQ
jgi:hypothetical protein